MFKATISSQLWHSKSLFSFFSLGIQSHIHQFGVKSCCSQFGIRSRRSQFGVQNHSFSSFQLGFSSHHLFTVWRSKSSFIVWHSEPSYLQFGVQSCIFSFAFKAIGQLGIQSHHISLVRRLEPHSQHIELSFFLVRNSKSSSSLQAFIVISPTQLFRVTVLIRRSKPLPQFRRQSHLPQFGVQSYFPQFRRSKLPCSFQAFRATWLSLGIQSHLPQFRRSDPSCLVQAIRATFLVLGIQSHFLSLGVQSPLPQLGIQSHFFRYRCSEPFVLVQAFRSTLLSLGVQSHLPQFRPSEPFSPQMFRATTFSTQAFKATSPTQVFKVSFINLGVQSCFAQFHLAQFRHSKSCLSIQVFRAILISFSFFKQAFKATSFLVRCSKPLSQLSVQSHFSSLGVQSHFFCLGVQSHLPQFRRSEPPSLSYQAFRAIIFIRCSKPFLSQAFKVIPPIGVQSHLHQFHRRSEPQAFRAVLSMGVLGHHFLSQALRVISRAQMFRATLLNLGVQSHLFQFRCSESLPQRRRSEPFHQFRNLEPLSPT